MSEYLKQIKLKIIQLCPKWLYLKLTYFRSHGYFPNLKHPKYFSEKIQLRKLNEDKQSVFTQYADKFNVRDYVAQTIGEEYLIELLYHGDSLPLEQDMPVGNYVIKATHDSGSVKIIRDSKYNYKGLEQYFAKALKRDYGLVGGERWYSGIKPAIIIEKMLTNDDGELPEDYKIHVFKNELCILQVDYDRFTEHTRDFYDEKLQKLSYGNQYPLSNYTLSQKCDFSKMFELAKKLSKPFDYVRVDMYHCKGQVYFGELTFAPEAGYGVFTDKSFDLEWGNKW